MNWLFAPANAAAVGALGLLLGIGGFALTVIGLYLTYRQARGARASSEAAKTAVDNFRFRINLNDAARDLSEAHYALDITRRHLTNGLWPDGVDSYEDARRAIIRLQVSLPGLDGKSREPLDRMTKQIRLFCEKVDRASSGKGPYPEKDKALAAIRNNYSALEAVRAFLTEGYDT